MMEFKTKYGADGSREETRKLPMGQPSSPTSQPDPKYTGLAQKMLSGSAAPSWSPGKMAAGGRQLLRGSVGKPTGLPGAAPDMRSLLQFTKTPAGRDAIRSTVDRIISMRNNPQAQNQNPQQELIQSLMAAMNMRQM